MPPKRKTKKPKRPSKTKTKKKSPKRTIKRKVVKKKVSKKRTKVTSPRKRPRTHPPRPQNVTPTPHLVPPFRPHPQYPQILPVRPPVSVVPQVRRPQFLEGPVSLYILDSRDHRKRIVLLGDRHVRKSTCTKQNSIGIVAYLRRLFMNYENTYNKIPLDFFVEIDFDPSVRPDPDLPSNYLQDVMSGFHNCWQKLKTECEFFGKNNIRFHYSDVRKGVIHSRTDEKHAIMIKELHKLNKALDDGTVTKADVQTMIRFVKMIDPQDPTFLFKISKIDKALQRIPDMQAKELRNLMIRHLTVNPQMKALYEGFMPRLEQFLANMDFRHPHLLNEEFGLLYNHMLAIISPLFDIYTLARMFQFGSKNVLIFAGDAHIQNIREYLLGTGNYRLTTERLSNERGVNYQCLNISGTEPWFENVRD
jgi:hypothetical protein